MAVKNPREEGFTMAEIAAATLPTQKDLEEAIEQDSQEAGGTDTETTTTTR